MTQDFFLQSLNTGGSLKPPNRSIRVKLWGRGPQSLVLWILASVLGQLNALPGWSTEQI